VLVVRARSFVFVALAALAAAAGGCTLPPWVHQAPAFPPGASTWEIPLYEPLTRLGPDVVATVVGRAAAGREPPREEVLLFVDSGSSHSVLPPETFARLGIETSGSHFATIEDAGGVKRAWRGALIPEVRLGDRLALADVVAVANAGTSILGADILAAHGWQIDLDAGTLSLGAPAWADAPDVAAVPTRSFRWHAVVDLQVAGGVVPVLVDTGAPFTAVDVTVLRGLGLRSEPLRSRWPVSTVDPKLWIDTAFEGPVALGTLVFGSRRIMALPGAPSDVVPTRGMLGNDLLYTHAFQVTPAGLRLRARAPSPIAGAAARIARWRDLPTCPDAPGCVAADVIVRADGAPAVHVQLRAAPPRPYRYLFACAGADGQARASSPWVAVGIAHPVAGADVEVVFQPTAPLAWRRAWAAACGSLVPIDANPVIADGRPLPALPGGGTDNEAQVAFDMRHIRFD
jgi:predicted aspartyl protease